MYICYEDCEQINNFTSYLLWKTAACLLLQILSGNHKLGHRFPYVFLKLSCNQFDFTAKKNCQLLKIALSSNVKKSTVFFTISTINQLLIVYVAAYHLRKFFQFRPLMTT